MNIEKTINKIVDKVLNEELSKKVEEAVDAVSEDMGKMPEERDEFDGRDSEVVGVDSDIQKQRMEEEMDEEEMDEEEMEEGKVKILLRLMVKHTLLKERKMKLMSQLKRP